MVLNDLYDAYTIADTNADDEITTNGFVVQSKYGKYNVSLNGKTFLFKNFINGIITAELCYPLDTIILEVGGYGTAYIDASSCKPTMKFNNKIQSTEYVDMLHAFKIHCDDDIVDLVDKFGNRIIKDVEYESMWYDEERTELTTHIDDALCSKVYFVYGQKVDLPWTNFYDEESERLVDICCGLTLRLMRLESQKHTYISLPTFRNYIRRAEKFVENDKYQQAYPELMEKLTNLANQLKQRVNELEETEKSQTLESCWNMFDRLEMI